VSGRAAVLLDRDGVLIEDVDLLVRPDQIRVLDGVPNALGRLAAAGFALVVVTNQTIVARGLAEEDELAALNDAVEAELHGAGAPGLDGFYVCPHHPSATVERYRVDCECRKPRPGLVLRAAAELGLDLGASTLVGDRLSDVAAGAAAGCATVRVRTGAHDAPAIETPVDLSSVTPDFECADLAEAAEWILARR
jgi:D-glycero-D-manno-heptose 1,7-bisphosphate phosphatase